MAEINKSDKQREENKNAAARILAHQLEGIMLHSDLATMYAVLGNRERCKFHKCQALDEMKAHLYTATTVANEYGEAIEPTKLQRIAISATPVTADMSNEEIWDVQEHTDKTWKEWEEETHSIYQDMAEADPYSRLWQHLINLAGTELRAIERMEKKSKK